MSAEQPRQPWKMDHEISRSVLVRGSGDDEYACGQIIGMDSEDMQLVEAAPDLLAALKLALNNLNMPGNEYPSEVERDIRAAITKAEARL